MRPTLALARLATLTATLASLGAFAQSAPAPATTSPTLAAVKARGALVCGVIGSSANFSLPDSQGVMRGIDADSCRAIATAIFGDPTKVKYVSLTPTMSRETKSGVQFAAVNFYDAWGFFVPKASGITTTAKLNGASVCMIAGAA